MIDTHAHIKPLSASPTLPKIRATQIEDCLDWVVLSASCVQDSKENIELAKNNPKLLASVGIHPQEANQYLVDSGQWLEEIENLLKNHKNIVAVGECGLELTDGVDKNKQIGLFKKQIELAQKYNKALIVHSREASDETLEILKNYKNLRGVIHCYTGGKKRIKKYLEISDSLYFGIDGNLTYEDGLVEVVRNIPKDRLVLETDSPFLTPVPHRFETNYPEYVKFTYQKVAEIWGMSFEETEKIIDENARKLFTLK